MEIDVFLRIILKYFTGYNFCNFFKFKISNCILRSHTLVQTNVLGFLITLNFVISDISDNPIPDGIPSEHQSRAFWANMAFNSTRNSIPAFVRTRRNTGGFSTYPYPCNLFSFTLLSHNYNICLSSSKCAITELCKLLQLIQSTVTYQHTYSK